jgi:hypothetical protein
MPQATGIATGVQIDLASSKRNYQPGDALSGFIVWSSPQIGFVRVRLFGRVKTRIERKKVTRGRAILFDLTEILYNGTPCSQGQQARPFSVVIPTTSQKHVKANGNEAIRGGNKLGVKEEWLESANFLSTADNTGDLPLPFSYYYNAADMGVKAEAFVEYVLQAETAMSEQASKNGATLGLATLPLIIRIPRAVEISTRHLLTRGCPGGITAHSTDVDFDKSKLTFRHKMKKTFRSSSFPRFGFDIVVSTPTHIQLDDPTPFPFRVSLFPNLLPVLTNICPDGDVSKLPTVRVASLKLKLRSTTLIRCPASWMDDESDKYHEYKWKFIDPINYAIPVGGIKDTNSIYQPEVPTSKFTTATPSSPVESLDLGNVLKLRLTPLKTDAQGAMSEQFPRPIWPTFKTFSINVSYDIMYELKVECLGETDTVNNYNFARTRVTIVPPASDKVTEMKTRQGDIDTVGLAMAAGGFANQMLSAFVPGWPF